MCGSVGYVGAQSALDVVLAGLRRLAAPDYDSAGVAVLADGGLAAAKTTGRLTDLALLLERRPLPAGGSAVGHLRRATHGDPTEDNAHPQLDNAGRVAVVHDGDIADHARLRAELTARGHDLVSDTDTEAAAHLLAEAFSSCGELGEAMRQVCRVLRGTFLLMAVHADEPDALVAARRGLPLAVGVGDGEAYVASDPVAFPDDVFEVVARAADAPDEVVLLRRELDEVRWEITTTEGAVVLA